MGHYFATVRIIKTMHFVFKMMIFVFKMVNFVFKMMIFVFKMMNFAATRYVPTRIITWCE